MNDSIADLLLAEIRGVREELREFREDVANWRESMAERVATLETKVLDICGNGQPGRMTKAENNISVLQRFNYKVIGAAAGISSLISAIWCLALRLIHG